MGSYRSIIPAKEELEILRTHFEYFSTSLLTSRGWAKAKFCEALCITLYWGQRTETTMALNVKSFITAQVATWLSGVICKHTGGACNSYRACPGWQIEECINIWPRMGNRGKRLSNIQDYGVRISTLTCEKMVQNKLEVVWKIKEWIPWWQSTRQ